MSSKPVSQPDIPQLGLVLFLVLGAIGALTPLAIDMYLPAMPTIAQDLGVTAGAVQITLTVYTAGFAIGQLLHGPLADSFGRRPILLFGVFFFGVASAISATATTIESLTYIRTAQGFAGAAAAVIIQAVVRDMFDKEDFARTMSFVTLVITLAPLVAPMIGGHLAVWFGWRSIFWVLTAFSGVVIAAVLWKIPETLAPENRQPLRFRTTIRNYLRLCKNPVAMGLMFSGAFSFAGMFAFLTAGSFVYIDIYGVTPDQFGYLFGLNIVTMIIMTSINGRMVKKVGLHGMLRFGLSIQLFAGLGLLASGILDLGIWGTVPFVMLFIGTLSTIGSNSMGLLLSGYPTMAGTASSLAGTLRFGTGSVIGAIVAMLPGGTVWPMIALMAICSVLSAALYWTFGKKA
ncbi:MULTISPECIES: Bcr/CflA family multidrug efflux MFS transporter [Vibrio]|jgi:DHA1 family bicyclomycin/chloramphenicol resistance-like MFS transporter|uniref:Bcr/CflA family efflux transporter n=1 Tax=Vibrio mediterranei TaxID=689 RepID=A0AAN1FII5_9VIBR|nr:MULTISPECIES: Bcr/CflA family multidrug efflux MFS transporter [Vibrio]ASI91190.1 Bcr/CflA family drug resistance efflux transporter [Vibrio mediterranei]MCF4173259.1 Bcr/CflA family multidrug efflux MFS transporter [Vibrio sp. McD22-P3]MCG9627833.1 Bcr/CflA family multidrug efflux MFS transporter [Vibrio mediterranei]MCG9658198.1 Bcr/CflA family multidrug efflux MFS transporter [Vibrio mediterranei]MCG9787240.1 Bcr/CflA family multidrug efflux MFS transporter [Vibrio mediterranei]